VVSLPDHLMPAAVGKERLSKEIVEEHQRDRVLAAAAGVFARLGYPATTVDDLVTAARIGVGSFYALFGGKEDCFLRLYDRIVADARERIGDAVDEDAPWAARVRTGLRVLLELVAAEPDHAQIVIVEAHTAGPAAESRYAETVGRLTAVLRDGRSAETAGEAPSTAFEDAAVPGLAWILHQRLAVGEIVVVDELLPEMAGFLIEPYTRT
jgi:AcrR family transcriptional regulator